MTMKTMMVIVKMRMKHVGNVGNDDGDGECENEDDAG